MIQGGRPERTGSAAAAASEELAQFNEAAVDGQEGHAGKLSARWGEAVHNRPLTENPDEYRDYRPEVCERCGGRFGPEADEELIGEYDEIEILPAKPYVTRHRRYACRCGRCGLPG